MSPAELAECRAVALRRQLPGGPDKVAAPAPAAGSLRSCAPGRVRHSYGQNHLCRHCGRKRCADGRLAETAARATVQMDVIIREVCRAYGCTRADLEGGSPARRFTEPRRVCYWLGRELANISFPNLARNLGQAHPSGQHGWAWVREQVAVDAGLRPRVAALRELCAAALAKTPEARR